MPKSESYLGDQEQDLNKYDKLVGCPSDTPTGSYDGKVISKEGLRVGEAVLYRDGLCPPRKSDVQELDESLTSIRPPKLATPWIFPNGNGAAVAGGIPINTGVSTLAPGQTLQVFIFTVPQGRQLVISQLTFGIVAALGGAVAGMVLNISYNNGRLAFGQNIIPSGFPIPFYLLVQENHTISASIRNTSLVAGNAFFLQVIGYIFTVDGRDPKEQ